MYLKTGYENLNAWGNWTEFTVHLHGRHDQSQVVLFPLDGHRSYHRKLHASLVTGLDGAEVKTCQKSAALLSSWAALTRKISSSYIGKMNYSSSLTWPGMDSSPVEHLRVCTYILSVSNNREARNNYSAPSVSLSDTWGCHEQGKLVPKPANLHTSSIGHTLYPRFQFSSF